MKNAIYLAFALAACATLTTHADSVTSNEALTRIVAQMNSHAAASHRAPVSASAFNLAKVGTMVPNATSQPVGAPAYYVFNRTGGGFVVAPADDTQPAILAIIDEGEYNETTLPDGFKAWLNEVIAYPPALPISAAAPFAKSVSPLLADDQIAWTQTAPFNTDCPKFYYGGYNYETIAGCAAIAAGQIMRYHKWPEQGQGSVDYTSYVGIQYGQTIETHVSRDFSQHTYDWTKIRGNYTFTGSGTKEERAEVAKFVADVACACKMNFDPTASETTDLNVAQALKRHFDYDPSLQFIDHCYYSTEAWAALLRAELDAKRPVYLSGANVTNTANGDALAGHAFVVDGYNADGLFHINWGWGGTSDGYFALTSLNPNKQGSGGSAGGYSFMSNAIIGIQPYCGGEETPAFLSLAGEYWETSYDNEVEGGGYKIFFTVTNPTATDFDGFIAIRVMEGDQMIMHPKQMAWKLGCKAGASGALGKGIMKDYFISHPTARLELVYALCPGASTADAATQTAMLESIADDCWLPVAAREGAPKSLQTFVDAKNNLSFGNKPDEVFQLRLAGLTSDITPGAGRTVKFTATVTNESDYEYFAPLYLFLYDSNGNQVGYSNYDLHHLPAHTTKCFDFDITLPSGYKSYAVAYEDKGYDWSYVPMPLYQNEDTYTTDLFTPLLDPDNGEGGQTPDGSDNPDAPTFDGTIAAVGDPVPKSATGESKGSLNDFPTEGVGYYIRNIDSGCYLNIVASTKESAVLSNSPEQFYFRAVIHPYTGETGYNVYTIDDNQHWLGGHNSNTYNLDNNVKMMWYVREVSPGAYAFFDVENLGYTDYIADATDDRSCYLGFDNEYWISSLNRIQNFATNPYGLHAFRHRELKNHALFSIELPGSANGHIYGDVDENRTVNSADVDALIAILLRQKSVTPEADTDLSRFITVGDVTTLIKHLKDISNQ